MRMFHVPPDTRVLDIAKEVYLAGKPEMPAVLLIHGFTGSPYELSYLGNRLSGEGFTVHIPRLPGHGTNGDDFLRTGAREWFSAAAEAYLNLRRTHDTVYIAGLSMGGVISLILAAIFPVDRIALAAPAVAVNNGLIRLTRVLGAFIPRIPKSYQPNSADPPELQELRKIYEAYSWVRPAGELRLLQKTALRMLPSIQARTLVLVSKNDRTVPLAAADIVEKRIGSRDVQTVVFETSSHLITNDTDREAVADRIIGWFQ